jgi:hypothetical protein
MAAGRPMPGLGAQEPNKEWHPNGLQLPTALTAPFLPQPPSPTQPLLTEQEDGDSAAHPLQQQHADEQAARQELLGLALNALVGGGCPLLTGTCPAP